MLSEGTYRARGITAAVGVNKNGKDFVAVTFEILEGDHARQRVDDVWYFASEKSTAITIEKLQAAGVTYERGDITDLTGFGEVEVYLTLKLEVMPNGAEKMRIAYCSEPGAGRGKPLDDAERRAMASRWASVLRTIKKPARKREDLPF